MQMKYEAFCRFSLSLAKMGQLLLRVLPRNHLSDRRSPLTAEVQEQGSHPSQLQAKHKLLLWLVRSLHLNLALTQHLRKVAMVVCWCGTVYMAVQWLK